MKVFFFDSMKSLQILMTTLLVNILFLVAIQTHWSYYHVFAAAGVFQVCAPAAMPSGLFLWVPFSMHTGSTYTGIFMQLSTIQAHQITRHAFFSKSKICLGFILWFLLSRHDASESVATIAICIHECSIETMSVFSVDFCESPKK